MNIFKGVGLIMVLFLSCNSSAQRSKNDFTAKYFELSNQFKNFWYAGKAEVNSFKLKQVRYGEYREGEAVMIFVTEPFSKSKQVKLDNPTTTPDAISVLKMNFTRNFLTGIYPYSMMVSVFQPVELNKQILPLKTTTTSQEWCGHTFTQFNLKKNKYEVTLRSYFESEGDREIKLEGAWLEDQLWNLIRIDPKQLPLGDIYIIPGSIFQRLKHAPIQIEKAKASIEKNESVSVFTLDYVNLNRSLKITFKNDFPFQIQSWKESVKSGFGKNAKQMTTEAFLEKSLLIDYWFKNSVKDTVYRDSLRLMKY